MTMQQPLSTAAPEVKTKIPPASAGPDPGEFPALETKKGGAGYPRRPCRESIELPDAVFQ
jgi:hypothetical protein